ncbi:hypothetical protein HZZ02_23910, partial [Streptococcus danieliae]|nr:hypothetical protein [Streptococcus danieliae]
IDHAADGASRRAGRISGLGAQVRHSVIGAVDVAGAVNQHQSLGIAHTKIVHAHYNHLMRATPLFILLSLVTGSVLAQNTTAAPAASAQTPQAQTQGAQDNSAAPSKNNQRIEHIRVEDAGSRVDET